MTIDINSLTFGIEIECLIPASVAINLGGYHCGEQIAQLPTGWNAQRDRSIQLENGYRAVEIVSPILQGADGVRQVLAVCKWLSEIGAKVNRSTGFHVHVGWTGDAEAMKRLAFLTSNFEKAIYAATGTHSREQGTFCRGIREDATYKARFVEGRNVHIGNRYHVLNLTNLARGRHTVEFRAFAGTINAVKILGYIRMCLAIVEKALTLKRIPKWVAKTPVASSPITRGGEGQTELNRFFYTMGWTKGRADHVYGNVTAEDAPTPEAIKKELSRLAQKYDKTN